MDLATYGESVMDLALRGLEAKTLDRPSLGWRKAVGAHPRPPTRADDHPRRSRPGGPRLDCRRGQPVHLEEQPGHPRPRPRAGPPRRHRGTRPGWRHRMAARMSARRGRARQPALAGAAGLGGAPAARRRLVARSHGRFAGWADIVEFTACTAARIGETSGVRRADINRPAWTWRVRRQTTPPGQRHRLVNGR
jgi:hypothetical protein